MATIETIPGAVLVSACKWAKDFVKKTDPMTATDTAKHFRFSDCRVFKNVRDVCRILCNYNVILSYN